MSRRETPIEGTLTSPRGAQDPGSQLLSILRDDISPMGEDGGSRILIYSHDTYGLGHFRRCLKIAREVRSQSQDASVLLLTGSPLAHQFAIPNGVDFVKLPSVIKTGNEDYRPRSLNMSIHDLVAMRSRLIRETARSFHPDVVLIDHAPLGLRNEVLPALESLREQSTRPAMILGLRDIIDEPDRVISSWRESHIYEAIDRFFDRIIVYGQSSTYDTCAEYQFPESLRAKTSYSGFISGSNPELDQCLPTMRRKRPMVLVTVGGGEDGGQIIDTFIAMIRRHIDEIGFDSVVLPGPLLSESRVNEIRRASEGLPVQVHHFVADVTTLLAESDLVISMGGYNAVAEILAHAHRALLIPREWPRQEQFLRAQRMTTLGYTDMLRMKYLNAESLWSQVISAMSKTDSPVARMRENDSGSLTGAAHVATTLLQSIRQKQNKESSK